MTDNKTTELLKDLLLELMDEYAMDDFTPQTKFARKYAERIEQDIAATLGSDDRYDAGFASGVQSVFQQLEGIEDYEELQDIIAEYWYEGEGNDER